MARAPPKIVGPLYGCSKAKQQAPLVPDTQVTNLPVQVEREAPDNAPDEGPAPADETARPGGIRECVCAAPRSGFPAGRTRPQAARLTS
jgi:hypothetical protein